MVKMLRPMGNSYGLIIDRPIMALLGMEPNTPLDLTTHDGALVLRPMKETNDRKSRVRRAANRMATVHQKALKDLAD
jgi:antitoxin component of MazEF toxin-antitoxin module